MAKKQTESASQAGEENKAEGEGILDPVVAELAAQAEELAAAKEQLLRLAAEYENFRKRSQREKEESHANTCAATIGAFLPVLDNLERAASVNAGSAEEYGKGIAMILEQFTQVLAAQGAEAFGTPGDAFDPSYYMAVQHGEDADFGENTVSAVLQKGWRLGERLIRVATVMTVN
ncbi:MAG: nucleotide exchange factor GrpE [Oscillospiraceae bacterium]|jgi:molecular chaperone GrpE|nr:nucleotide exchange factor GrpE [Oscillospiraceae bacterium]